MFLEVIKQNPCLLMIRSVSAYSILGPAFAQGRPLPSGEGGGLPEVGKISFIPPPLGGVCGGGSRVRKPHPARNNPGLQVTTEWLGLPGMHDTCTGLQSPMLTPHTFGGPGTIVNPHQRHCPANRCCSSGHSPTGFPGPWSIQKTPAPCTESY